MTAKPDLSRPGLLRMALLLAFPALLLLPVLYYSLTTPFGLIDDYHDWQYAALLEDPGRLFRWLQAVWDPGELEHSYLRYRPFWTLYNAVAWKVLGDNPALHHLTRWLFHFAAVFCFAAAFWRIGQDSRRPDPAAAKTGGQFWLLLLSLVLLVYTWLFFPNAPAARLSPPEVHTAFFLGLCLWMLARRLARAGQSESLRSALLTYILFFLGYCGLAWSKETNIALLPGLLIAWYVPILWARFSGREREESPPAGNANRPRNRAMLWQLLGGLPLVLVFLHTLASVYTAASQASYGTATLTPGLLGANSIWLLGQLFQWETSPVITVGFALLALFLLGWVGFRANRRPWNREWIFTLILLGLFASMYLMLCISWEQFLRYWYPLIPLFAILLAFAAKFALAAVAGRRTLRFRGYSCSLRPAGALLLAGFVLFFVAANYYNFLYQTAAQHYLRSAETQLLAEITRLRAQGQYVQIIAGGEETTNSILFYFDQFAPHFYGQDYPLYQTPPPETGQSYYIVNYTRAYPEPDLTEIYRPLAYARTLAAAVQFGRPYQLLDASVFLSEVWHIYAQDLSAVWSKGRSLYRTWAELDDPAVRSGYALYRRAGYLIYRRENCGPEEDDRKFYAHIWPVDIADLPEWRQGQDSDNLDSPLENSRFRNGERCVALLPLPTYPIRSINTGQYVPEQGEVWSAELFLTLE